MPIPHTHQSRQPSRVVRYIRSGLSPGYAMAGLRFVISGTFPTLGIPRTAFGQLPLAGLSIYRRGRPIDSTPKITRTITAHSPSGAATSHQGQSIHPSSLAAIRASTARPAARSHFNNSSP